MRWALILYYCIMNFFLLFIYFFQQRYKSYRDLRIENQTYKKQKINVNIKWTRRKTNDLVRRAPKNFKAKYAVLKCSKLRKKLCLMLRRADRIRFLFDLFEKVFHLKCMQQEMFSVSSISFHKNFASKYNEFQVSVFDFGQVFKQMAICKMYNIKMIEINVVDSQSLVVILQGYKNVRCVEVRSLCMNHQSDEYSWSTCSWLSK